MKRLLIIGLLFLIGCGEEVQRNDNGFTIDGEFHETPYGFYHKDRIDDRYYFGFTSKEISPETQDFINKTGTLTAVAMNGVAVSPSMVGDYIYDGTYGSCEGFSVFRDIELDVNGDGIESDEAVIIIESANINIKSKSGNSFIIDYTAVAEDGRSVMGHYSDELMLLKLD